MRHFRPKLGGDKTHDRNPEKGIDMNITNGIRYIHFSPMPNHIKPKAPATAIGKPQAADVATAFCITTP